MKKLLFILFLVPFWASSQIGINTRIDLDYSGCAFTGLALYKDSIFIVSSIKDTQTGQTRRVFLFSSDESFIMEDSYSTSSTYWRANKASNLDSLGYVSVNLSNGVNDSLVLYKFDIRNKEVLVKNYFELIDTYVFRLYESIHQNNSIYSVGGHSTDANASDVNGMILSSSLTGDTLFIKKYYDPVLDLEFSSAKPLINGNVLVGGRKYDWAIDEIDDIHQTYIMEIDSSGTIQWEWTDSENLTYMPYAIAPTSDGGVIYGAQKGWFYSEGNYNRSLSYLTKLDSSHDIEWELEIGGFAGLYAFDDRRITDIIEIDLDTFVISGVWNDFGTVKGFIMKIDIDGNVLWRRDIAPPIVSTEPEEAIFYDMAVTSDGGFIMVGESKDPDGVGANQQGWLVKTNCLGYLAPPSASCITSNLDNYCIRFANSSLQGGEFEWDFGDTEVQITNESEDTIVHVFSGEGTYNVRLIAKGCNGEADTIYFDVNPTLLGTNEQNEFGEGIFDVYPSPASNIAYVSFNYLAELNNANIIITDLSGKAVQSVSINQNELVQEFNVSNFSKGIYLINFMNDGKLIKTRKLIVN